MGDQSQANVITAEDRKAANELGALLGVSGDDLIREFVEEWEQLTPSQQAEFEQLIDTLNEVLPDMNVSLDCIQQNLARSHSTMREMNKQMTVMSDRVSRIEHALTCDFMG